MKKYRVNSEYEYELFAKELGFSPEEIVEKRQIWGEVDFMFFVMNKEPSSELFVYNDYTQSYLDYLASLGFLVPTLTANENGAINWYGKLEDLELERNLNSKAWTYRFIKSIGHPVNNLNIINSSSFFNNFDFCNKKWLMKSCFTKAGSGFQILQNIEDVKPFVGERILEPFYERVLDYSIHYDPENDKTFDYITVMNETGQYIGGIIFDRDEEKNQYLASLNYLSIYRTAVAQSLAILTEIKKLKLNQKLTIDGFLYSENGRICAYPLCEINYRMNMGSLLDSLKVFVPPSGVGQYYEFKIKNNKHLDQSKWPRFNVGDRNGLIFLSSTEMKYVSIFFIAQSLIALNKLKHSFFKVLNQ
jgi:hypothetical protein